MTRGGLPPLRALMAGALSGARESGGDDAAVISIPPPSGAPSAPGSRPSVASTHDAARLRELRLSGRGARPRPPRLRDARDVGHAGVAPGGRRDRAVVRLVPFAVPARARRERRRTAGVTPGAAGR